MSSKDFRQRFTDERYEEVTRPFLSARIDLFFRSVEARSGKNKGNIMSFVRGLRLSALVIYQIRNILSASDLSAYWGQILNDDGTYLSNECDIIISKKDSFESRWNGSGDGNNIMDFRFIEKHDVKAVISCKSFLTPAKIEKEYCESVLKYIDKVWLLAECCGPRSIDKISTISTGFGYEYFWPLYTWSRGTGNTKLDKEGWRDFEEKILSLV